MRGKNLQIYYNRLLQTHLQNRYFDLLKVLLFSVIILMRPRDSKGRYNKIHSDIFGNKTPPFTNPRDRNTGNEIESNNTQKPVELGIGPEGIEVTLGE